MLKFFLLKFFHEENFLYMSYQYPSNYVKIQCFQIQNAKLYFQIKALLISQYSVLVIR